MKNSLLRIPGFVDAHVHIESSMMVPSEFGRIALRHGTVAAICDPHEIVNVCGEDGLKFMLEDARKSPCDLFFELPSCVPASSFETSGAVIDAAFTAELFRRYPELVGLGEMMDCSGVLSGNPDVLGKIEAARSIGKPVDGHFPCGRGDNLKRYAAAGITSDHETSSIDEAREKLEAGMMLFIREGSSARNFDNLIGVVTRENADRICFCADDISAADLLEGGDILRCFKKAVRAGLPVDLAVEIACVNPRRHFNLPDDDDSYVLLDAESDYSVVEVVKDGRKFR